MPFGELDCFETSCTPADESTGMCSYCVHVQSMYYLIKYVSIKTSTMLSEIIIDLTS